MDSVMVFIHFGGVWDESNKYIDYSVCGIIVPFNCSYNKLTAMIASHLQVEESNSVVNLQYQVYEQGPLVPICDESSLEFYVELKRGEKDKRAYPICVDVDALTNSQTDTRCGDTLDANCDNNQSHAINIISNEELDALSSGPIVKNPTLEEMGMELAEYVNSNTYESDDEFRNVITVPTIEEVKKGIVFKNKELVVMSAAIMAFKNRFQFRVTKSDCKFYWLKCFEDGCCWTMKASRTGCVGYFKIREMNDIHTCSTDSVTVHHRQATSYVIALCIKQKFLSTRRIYTPADIIDDMHHAYGVLVSYDKAWRARDRAIQMIRGDPYESYGNLPAYMHRLEIANPGSFTRIEVDAEGRFLFSFVALGASISGWEHCKPVIVVDGTFLTSKQGGTLFTASTQDANNNIFILAFGVGDSENNGAWDWFMMRLKEAYGNRDELCIVSDRHGSIAHAVEKVFPDSLHGACTYHLLKNLRKEFGKKGKGMRIPFNAASRAYTTAKFETHMARLDVIDKGIRPYLEEVGYERWSRAYMTRDRYSTMTSNIAESVNSAIKYAKNYPIEALFECLRCTIQRWFSHNLKDAMSTFTRLATRHDTMLREKICLSKNLRVRPSSDTIFQVNDETTAFVVDMNERTCSCRRFQLDHIPCPHAVAVIAVQNYQLSDYCSKYFTKEEYLATYQESIYPLGNKEDWDVPDHLKERIILAPLSKRGPGRPKENRYKSYIEYKSTNRCRKCDEYGHNSRTCHNPTAAVHRNPKRKRSNTLK